MNTGRERNRQNDVHKKPTVPRRPGRFLRRPRAFVSFSAIAIVIAILAVLYFSETRPFIHQTRQMIAQGMQRHLPSLFYGVGGVEIVLPGEQSPRPNVKPLSMPVEATVIIETFFEKIWKTAIFFWHITFWVGFFVGLLGFLVSIRKSDKEPTQKAAL